jgi:C_GCAxxG_C_C family probable redox protein
MTCSCAGLFAAQNFKAFARGTGEPGGSMADWTEEHLSEGYWSADSILLSAAKYLKKPEQVVSVATGFGGGILQKDLCGYLTGGVMAIGLFAGATRGGDKAGREQCHRLTKEYADWWAETYPLHCKDMPQPCDFKGMGEAASRFLQKIFEREARRG